MKKSAFLLTLFQGVGHATAPAQFQSGDWSLADRQLFDEARITIASLPSNGGSAITAIEYQINGGSWVSTGLTAPGTFDIQSGLAFNTSATVAIRAVNAVGNGTASATKSVTPTYDYQVALGSALVAVWDANDLATADGAAVAAWNDRVGAYSLAQGTGGAQPVMNTTGLNGGKAVSFDGVDDVLEAAGAGVTNLPLDAAAGGVWALFQDTADPASDTSVRVAASYGSTTTIMRAAGRGVVTSQMRVRFSLQGTTLAAPSGNAYNVPKLHRGVYDGTNANLYVDGVLVAGPTAVTPATTSTRIRAGANASGSAGQFWQGRVAVFLLVTTLSASQASKLTSYLKARGGIT